MSKLTSKELGKLRGRLNDQIQFDRELTPAAKNIGYIIASRMMAINDARARASNTELMAWAGGCDEKTVTRAIKNLVSRGHFNLESRCRGDRVFVPVLKEVDREKCPSKPNKVDHQKNPSRPGKMPVATGTPTQETTAAEGLLKPPSLNPSLNPSSSGLSDDDFKRFKRTYPASQFVPGKAKLRTALEEAIEGGATIEALIEAAACYAKEVAETCPALDKVYGALKFLNDGLWKRYNASNKKFAPSTFAGHDSDQWRAWDAIFRAGAGPNHLLFSSAPCGSYKVNGSYENGYWFSSEWPPEPEGMVFVAANSADFAAWKSFWQKGGRCTILWPCSCYVGGVIKSGFWFKTKSPPNPEAAKAALTDEQRGCRDHIAGLISQIGQAA